jgi:flagellar biosynthesis protein FliP
MLTSFTRIVVVLTFLPRPSADSMCHLTR